MNKRLALDAKLKSLFGTAVSVYFQPPNNLEIQVPACVYDFDGFNNKDADGVRYLQFERYRVKMIVPTVSDPIIMSLLKNPQFAYVTMYPSGATQFTYLFRTTI